MTDPRKFLTIQSGIKYRYALDGELIVDIKSQDRPLRQDYTCLSCGKVLRPVYGTRQSHFRHKKDPVQFNCSNETYLHNLAKNIFFQTYSHCLVNNLPFMLEYRVPTRCVACKEHGPCIVGYELKHIDLTRHFKEIHLETQDGGFKPDILLKKGNESLYIEIVVTHFIEEKKEKSGVRIIEIVIGEESDIEFITSRLISETHSQILVSNFHPLTIDGNYKRECQKMLNCFILHASGKSIARSIPAWEFEKLVTKGVYVEHLNSINPYEYVDKVAELHKKGKNIKNCWLCTFHCLNYQSKESYCKLHKKHIEEGGSNQAVECADYKLKKNIPENGLVIEAINQLYKPTSVPVVKLDNKPPQAPNLKREPFKEIEKPVPALKPIPIYRPLDSSCLVEVQFQGLELDCGECQSPIYFVTSVRFEQNQHEVGSLELLSYLGSYYSKSKLDKLLAVVQGNVALKSIATPFRKSGFLIMGCAHCRGLTPLSDKHYPEFIVLPLFKNVMTAEDYLQVNPVGSRSVLYLTDVQPPG